MSHHSKYDVIVVGGGHAGCEAAAAAANLGSKVLLVTMNMGTIAQMSCNPAMGGIAKGQIVREIDAMGGYSGIISDRSAIQFRMLNRSKGPAMWSPRTQNDRMRFAEEWRIMLEQTPNVDFWQDMVTEVLLDGQNTVGVRTSLGAEIEAKSVILTNGTFLNGIIHLGEKQFGGGRAGERAAIGITEQLINIGFEAGRMKTGTPPRVDGRSLNYEKMEIQHGDETPSKFSFSKTTPVANQLPCHIAYTNEIVHGILREGFEKSPMFNGRIQGLGPRYCPSIEDKIERFSDRNRHQLFIEPEGRNTVEIYVNGFSTSLPEDVQMRALKQIPGFEQVKMFRPGYAIEYDYFPPTQLNPTLETRSIENLYFAGQINGTTGYEEAACQGLIAGINAHQKNNSKEPIILKRSEAYIGVLIDDLVNKGTNEPYRMFTSRAEYRILLRQDNADLRLTPMAHKLGLASDERMKQVERKISESNNLIEFFRKTSIEPSDINEKLIEKKSQPLRQKVKMHGVLSRPHITMNDFLEVSFPTRSTCQSMLRESVEQAEIQIKYNGYISKEQEMADKINQLEGLVLHDDFDYSRLTSLSSEAREKLQKHRPKTIGQASRITGISPADVSILMVYLGR